MPSKYNKAITVQDAFGNSVRKTIHAKSEEELEAKEVEIKYLNSKGILLHKDGILFKDLVNKWYETKQVNNEDSTKTRNKGIIEKHIIPEIGNIPIKALKPYHIDKLLNKQKEKGLTDTIRKTFQIIHAALEFGVNNDYIYKNVADKISPPRFHSKEKAILTKEERAAVEKSKSKYRDLFVFIMYTGLRKGEVAALKWEDVDFEKGVIAVDEAISFVKNKGNIKDTKSGRIRYVPILSKTKEILEKQPRMSEFVFYKQDHTHLSDSAFDWYLSTILNDTGLKFTLHQLRHTFCTILYYSGISLKEAQRIMGHASVETTLKIYTHLDEQEEKGTAEKLNKYIGK